MPIQAYITDKRNGRGPRVDFADGEDQALVVATRELKTWTPTTKFFLSDTYGADMNVNVAFGGTAEEVHDGTDTAYWTGSSIVGDKFTFNSTDQFHAGSKSVKVDNAAVNDVAQLAKGSDLTVSSYTAISLWVYVDKDWKAGDDITLYGWDTGTGQQVGLSVGLQDYFNWAAFDAWQQMAVPLTDMELTEGTIDALRLEISAAEGKSPKFYLDDIQFEQTGTPATFHLQPDAGTWWHLDRIQVTLAAAYDTDEANGTLPGIAYDDILGVSPSTGIVYQRIDADGVVFTNTVRQIADWLQFPTAHISSAIHDGTNTLVTVSIEFAKGTVLKALEEEELRVTVTDNLSGLLMFRMTVSGYSEERA